MRYYVTTYWDDDVPRCTAESRERECAESYMRVMRKACHAVGSYLSVGDGIHEPFIPQEGEA